MTGKIHICYQLIDPVTGETAEAVRGVDQELLETMPDKTTCLYGRTAFAQCSRSVHAVFTQGTLTIDPILCASIVEAINPIIIRPRWKRCSR